jgi:formylglycine-generating enzyme required for sulfatase activity
MVRGMLNKIGKIGMRQALKALCLSVALAAFGVATASAQENVAGPVLKDAYDLYQSGKLNEASQKFEQGLRMSPTRAQAAVGFFMLGETYRDMGDGAKAKANYEASLQADPNSQVAGQARDRLNTVGSASAGAPPGAPPPLQPPQSVQPPPGPGFQPPPQAQRLPVPPPPRPPAQQAVRPPAGPPPGQPPAQPPQSQPARPGQVIKDCPTCPEVVVIPPGQFNMGSNNIGGDEKPVHPVTITRPIAMGRFEVQFAEYDACFAAGGCRSNVSDLGFGRGSNPVIHVSWNDAQDYVRWLSSVTGQRYRLPTEAEWEYAARGGSAAEDVYGAGQANCDGCGSPFDNRRIAPVGRFPPNGFGLYDMLGNVWEWTLDCWNDNYRGAPLDGSPWLAGECVQRVIRGGSWKDGRDRATAAYRHKDPITDRDPDNGFRVVRELQ